ncbi:MAG: tRNA (adenosine(37)-N6)-threonylcarbamoyltransferase complex dimerization subunit type 1 TsaB [Gemmatimonadales bacterium]
MTTLAFDTATDRCTVAARRGDRVASRIADGSRSHATRILELIDATLGDVGATVRDITRLLTGDGPGSFTGLRVAASVAKGLLWYREVQWLVAPSLLIRACGQAPMGGATVLALSDALRGELYAGCWVIGPDGVTRRGPAPRAMAPGDLARFGPVDVVVGSIPAGAVAAVATITGVPPITGDRSLPDARVLLTMAELPGATSVVNDPASWEPEYGRPAEAQAVWERTHGRPLATAIRPPR